MQSEVSRFLFRDGERIIVANFLNGVNHHVKHVRIHLFYVLKHRIVYRKTVAEPIDGGI
ncbi:hypothetical protein D3C76_1615090 [compost metagenome]